MEAIANTQPKLRRTVASVTLVGVRTSAKPTKKSGFRIIFINVKERVVEVVDISAELTAAIRLL